MTAAALPKEHGNEHAAVVQAAPSWEVALRVRLHMSSPAVLSALGTLLTKSGQCRSKYRAETALFRHWHCDCLRGSGTRRTPFARRCVETRSGKSGDGFTADRWFRRRQ